MSDCKYDKKIIHGSESDKKALISLILKAMHEKGPSSQYVQLDVVSEAECGTRLTPPL